MLTLLQIVNYALRSGWEPTEIVAHLDNVAKGTLAPEIIFDELELELPIAPMFERYKEVVADKIKRDAAVNISVIRFQSMGGN